MADLEHFESLADREIRKAMERGEFDDLPGRGEPLPDAGRPYDPMWWVRRWLERNRDPNDDAEQNEGSG